MLADGTRLRLMWLLRDGEYDVGELTAAVGAARPAVSQHLAKLRLDGLVCTRRLGGGCGTRRGAGTCAAWSPRCCTRPTTTSARPTTIDFTYGTGNHPRPGGD